MHNKATKYIPEQLGSSALKKFIRANNKLFNLSELERLCEFPSGTLRHIAAGSRDIENYQYKKMSEVLTPKVCELVYILQNYS